MAYRDYYGSGGGRGYGSVGGSNLPPAVKWLLIANVAIFFVYFFAYRTGYAGLFTWLGLMPAAVVKVFAVWQLAIYLFVHSPLGFTHVLFNMLTLWMFGKELENLWGTKKFLQYYFLCGIGAGIFVVVLNLLFGSDQDMHSRTIGASGAIYGLLMAFGVLFPEQTVFFWVFPMKAKYFVAILGAMSFMMTFGDTGGGISHMAHLGGMAWGYAYLRSRGLQKSVGGVDPVAWLGKTYRTWRQDRAKKRFQVYLKKQSGDRDRWVH